MSLRIRRGTNAQRTSITFDLGEIVYTTDTQKLYIGDGVTAGGKNLLETSAGNGFTFNPTTQQIDFAIGNLNLNTAQVSESSNLYFTTERAQDAVGAALVAGNAFNTGVTFTYDDANNRITAVSTGGLTNISADTNPSLGGNLSTGAFNISGNGSITASTITATTGLGANLPLNGKTINGTGNINITGSITATTNNSSAITGTSTNAGFAGVTAIGGLYAVSNNNPAIRLAGITDGQFNNSRLDIDAFKGTVDVKTNTVAGDSLGGIYIRGYHNSTYIVAAGIIASWNSDAQLTTAFPASTLLFFANGNGNVSNLATFDGKTGIFNSPVAQTTVYSVAGTALPNAVTMGVGARAFVSDATVNTFATAYTGGGSNKVPVYSDGTVWRIG